MVVETTPHGVVHVIEDTEIEFPAQQRERPDSIG